jgi:hypothetical protein
VPEHEGGEHGPRAFQLLLESARKVLGPGVDDAQTLAAALAAWSLPHGLAMLILDERIAREHVATADDAEALLRSAFAMWRSSLARSQGT